MLGAAGVSLTSGTVEPVSAGVVGVLGIDGVVVLGGCSEVSGALGSPLPSVGEGAPLSLGDSLGALGVVLPLGSGVTEGEDGVEGELDPDDEGEPDSEGAPVLGVLAPGEDDVGADGDVPGVAEDPFDGEEEAPGVGTSVGPSTL